MLERIRKFLVIKFILGLTLTLFGILAIITLINVSYQKNVLIKKETESFYRLEETILASLLYSMQKGDQEGIQKQFNDYRGLKGIKAVHLTNNKGVIRRSTDTSMVDKEFIDEKMPEALQGKEFSGVEIDKDTNLKVFRRLRPIFRKEECFRCHDPQEKVGGVLAFISDWSPAERALSVAQNMHILFFILSFALICGLIFFFGFKLVINPLQQLVKATQKIAAGDLTYQIEVETDDEIGRLGLSFNEMVKDINVAQEEIRQHSEEIAMANEELQAANEELIATNENLLDTTKDLKQSHMYLKVITNGINEGIMLLDRDFKILWVNQKIRELTGLSEGDILGNFCYKVTHRKEEPCQPPNDICPILDVLNTGRSITEVHKHYDKDGNQFYAEVIVYPVRDEKGEIKQFVHMSRDITERKKAEDEKEVLINQLKEHQEVLNRQKQELEESRKAIKNIAEDLRNSKEALEAQKGSLEYINKELDDFTYIVSHDLKEPLRTIDAFSKFIVDDYQDKLDENGRFYIERVRMNASRMQKLIEELLELSRLERKKNIFEEVEAEELIDEVKLRLEYRIKKKNAQIIIHDKLPRVYCDRVRLTEVFANLISNALKFNDKPSPRIEIGSNLKEGFQEFYVKDNGLGIEEQYFDKIFEIFQRLGKREDNEGTGAGLTIVKKIIQMHKGKIWLESKLEEGTTFYFTIPTKEKSLSLTKKKIGEVLVEKKLITEEDMKKALEEQGSAGI